MNRAGIIRTKLLVQIEKHVSAMGQFEVMTSNEKLDYLLRQAVLITELTKALDNLEGYYWDDEDG